MIDSNSDLTEVADTEAASGSGLSADREQRDFFAPEETPDRIGRFEVVELLGRGGMGVVYRARDPKLDRDVAVKLVRASADPSRLRREAQALAALSHPNVVQVFEVGEHGGEVFVAMEFVPGRDLEKWLEQGPSRDEVLGRLFEVSRGLTAAHRSGLLHRDIKPNNVIVGDDGRARLLDFGLVRLRDAVPDTDDDPHETRDDGPAPAPAQRDAENDTSIGSSGGSVASSHSSDPLPPGSALNTPLTEVGAVMGTPRYMAPEQLSGDGGSEASDQFSFCVTAYRALAGAHPFRGRFSIPIDGAFEYAELEFEADAALRRLLSVLRRGMAVKPDERWPSMEALHEALETARAPGRTRGRLAWILAGAASIGALWWSWPRDTPTALPSACTEGETAANVWTAEQRDALELTMLDSGRSHAEGTWSLVRDELDDHVARWTEAHTAACNADANAQAPVDARLQCLDGQRRTLAAVLAVLDDASPEVVDGATKVVGQLGDPSVCADPNYLRRQPERPSDPDTLATLLDAEEKLARFSATLESGRIDAAATMVESLDGIGAQLDHPPFSARLDLTVAQMLSQQLRTDEALARFERAFFTARDQGMTREAFDAATEAAFVKISRQRRLDEGRQWLRHAETMLAELDEPLLEARLQGQRAIIHEREGRAVEALDTMQSAVALMDAHASDGGIWLSQGLLNLAGIQARMGKLADAERSAARSLEARTHALGPAHPSLVEPLLLLSAVDRGLERDGDAEKRLRHALTLLDAVDRRHDIAGLRVLESLGSILRHQQRYEAAVELAEEAQQAAVERYGSNDVAVAVFENNLAIALQRVNRNDEAHAALARALAIRREALGPDDRQLLPPMVNLGESLLGAGRVEEAAGHLTRALELVQRSGGSDFERAMVLIPAAQLAQKQGQPTLAVERAREAVALLEAREGELANLARARLALGDGMLAAGSSHEAIALVRRAADELAPHRQSADDIWSMLERWLAEHDPKHRPKAP
ncbi:MAG: serine/threonine-protein kinase [Myxococcota bacterium]